MDSIQQLVVFHLDESRYALHLAAVERIVRVVEITPLPDAPEIVLGIVNVHGAIVPVVDVRKRFRLPVRESSLDDHLIIARTPSRTVGLVVDATSGVIERREAEIASPRGILPSMDYVEGVVKFKDGLILIHDLETFLSLAEEKALEQAIANA